MPVKLATMNLYHFAKPGIYWHERKDSKTHSDTSWTEKTDWVAATLADMDADIVAFQEVVSVDALRQLCEAAGYAEFRCETDPVFDSGDADIYVNATVAIASRHPVNEATAVPALGEIIPETVIDCTARFSRPPLRCEIDIPGIGGTVVYAAHFKSQGAFVDDDAMDAIADWDERIKAYFTQRMHAGVDQVSKRAAEAGAMYARFREDIEGDTDRPVVLLGDLNEGPESHTISILTQSDMIFYIGSVWRAHIPEEHRFRKYIHRLYDSYTLVSSAETKRPVTHAGWDSGETLDYAIVSNGLNPKNPRRRGTVVGNEVWNDHFVQELPKDVTSDHAPVIVTIEPGAV